METSNVKPSFLRNILVRTLLFFVLVFLARFAYVVTIAGESCNLGDFCFFSIPENLNLVVASTAGTTTTTAAAAAARSSGAPPARRSPYTEKQWSKSVKFYSSIFQDLISEGFLSPQSKSLCIESVAGSEVFALQKLGVRDSIGIYKKQSRPLVISGSPYRLPFDDETVDFIFSGGGMFEKLPNPLDVAAEIGRTLKPEGFFVIHVSSNDTYSFNSFLDLFNSCRLLRSLDFDGFDASMPRIREIVLVKEHVRGKNHGLNIIRQSGKKVTPGGSGNSVNKCSVPEYKQKLVRGAETLIEEEPLKPWITLKRNLKNIKYLSSLVDINFRNRYVYVDVGARSYGSSIGSWFRKQYPKQNKTFHVYAIEADKTFYSDYKLRKRVTLLPYAAWVKNETLSFEVNRDPGQDNDAPGRGMGRIQPARSLGGSSNGVVSKIRGFDFADWLKRTVSEKDYVVMKMDVEGTEFDLIPRLFKTGAICLVDELFLECHYNRWQRCCPGQRSTKYEHTYGQCLELFTSLRESGILVHQWW